MANYVRGVIHFLQKITTLFMVWISRYPEMSLKVQGLSSSAALEVAIGQTLKTLYQLPISQKKRSLNGQKQKTNLLVVTGIMDQLISACGEENHALLIDCRSLKRQP